jgi:hypothetical protein
VVQFSQSSDDHSVTLNLTGGFGTKRIQIIRSNSDGKDKFVLKYDSE